MAIANKITSAPDVEAFTVGFDADDHPIQKPVHCMTKAERLAALGHAYGEFQAALETVQPYWPLVEAEVMLTDLDAALPVVAKCFAFEAIRQQLLRLCNAVWAQGMH
jgi:hypothetical protein